MKQMKSKNKSTNDLEKEISSLRSQLDDILTEAALDRTAVTTKGYSFGGADGGYAINSQYSSIQENINKATLQKLLVTESWFYITVEAIAKTIASLPLKVEKRVTTTKTETINGVPHTATTESWVDASGEQVGRVFQFPNDLQSRTEFYKLILFDLLGTGEAYSYLDLTAAKTIQAMYRLNSAVTEPKPSAEGKYLDGFILNWGGKAIQYGTDEVVRFRLPNPCDPFRGLAPIVPVLKSVIIDRFIGEHTIRFYRQGARLGGVVKSTQKLTKEQITRLQRSFEADYTGRQNFHRTLVLPAGMEYQVIESKPAETQLIEFMKSNREPILSAYGVPPVKVGLLDGASYANAFVQLKIFFVDTIIPYASVIEEGFNSHPSVFTRSAGPAAYRVKFDLAQIEALQENLKEKGDAAASMLKGGATINEVRKKIWGLEPLTGGDVAPALETARKDQMFTLTSQREQVQETPAAVPGEPVAAPGTEQVIEARLSLNGAQMDAIRQIVLDVVSGTMPRDSAVQMIAAGYSIPLDVAESIVGTAGAGFTPTNLPNDRTGGQVEGTPAASPTPEGGKSSAPDAQPDMAVITGDVIDTGASFEDRVAQITAIGIAQGLSPDQAVRAAIARAALEGYAPGKSPAPPADAEEEDEDDEEKKTRAGGVHLHAYDAAAETTNTDGKHRHAFKLADDSIVWTDESGEHAHTIEVEPTESGEHAHVIEIAGEKYTLTGGAHLHAFGEDRTAEDGAHAHKLTLADGTELNSMTETEEAINRGDSVSGSASAPHAGEEKEIIPGFTRARLVEYQKAVTSGEVDKLIDKRLGEVVKFFEGFESAVMGKFQKNLRNHGIYFRVKADDDVVTPEAVQQLIDEGVLTPESLKAATRLGYDNALAQARIDNYPEEESLKRIRSAQTANMVHVVDTTKVQIRNAIAATYADGGTPAEVANAIREVFKSITGDPQTSRAMTIARTETLQAVSYGQDVKVQQFKKERPQQAGRLLKKWISGQDEVVRESHQYLDELEPIGVDEAWPNELMYPREPGGAPEEVINCFAPSTQVTGLFLAASKALYAGQMRKIQTKAGRVLTVTPGHKILTTRGWIAARDLNRGDDVIAYCIETNGAPVEIGKVNEYNGPSSIEQVFQSLAILNSPSFRDSRTADFNGDQLAVEGQIEVVRPDCGLLDQTHIPGRKEIKKLDLILKHFADNPLISEGASVSRGNAISGAASGSPCGSDLTLDSAAIPLDARPLEPLSIGLVSQSHARETHPPGQHLAAQPSVSGDDQHGFSRLVSADQIVEITDFNFTGHVYDVQTAVGALIADGIIAHNCRCAQITFLPEDADDVMDQLTDESDVADRKEYNPDQDRDDGGRWTSGGGGGGAKPKDEPAGGTGYERIKIDYSKIGPKLISRREQTNNLESGKVDQSTDTSILTSKLGSEVNDYDCGVFQRYANMELERNVEGHLSTAITRLKNEGIDVVDRACSARSKTKDSLHVKMSTKWKDLTLNNTTDGVGTRIVVRNMKERDKATLKLARAMGYKVLEVSEKDYDNGYRAVHYLLRTPGGMIAEMQLKTENQNTFSNWSHKIYKSPTKYTASESSEINSYAKAVSDHLYELDMGRTPGPRPQAPKVVQDHAIEFGWNAINNKPMKGT